MFGTRPRRSSTEMAPDDLFISQNLVNIGGSLSVPELLRAYRAGSFPWTVHPVTWWSPDPRAILELDRFHLSRSLARELRKGRFTITSDRAFREVMEGCAAPLPHRRSTWITPEFISAYCDLHQGGIGHSVEVWENGLLVGGVYGLALGAYFVGESMFHKVSNASKIALYHLVQHLKARGYAFLDVQMPTRVTLQLGVTLVPRREFLRRLHEAQLSPVSFGRIEAGEANLQPTDEGSSGLAPAILRL